MEGWGDGGAFWVLAGGAAWDLLCRLRRSWGVGRALRGRCPLPSEGRCLGRRLGGMLCVCMGSVCRECHHFRKGMGGSLPHTLLFFVQDFPLLRPAYVWDMCGTRVGHVRAANLTILYLSEYGVRGECTGSAIISGKGWGWDLPCTP